MITTDKNAAVSEFDILVRVGKFPTQGKKLVIQKGDTIISVAADDVGNLLDAIRAVSGLRLKEVATFEPYSSEVYCDTRPAR